MGKQVLNRLSTTKGAENEVKTGGRSDQPKAQHYQQGCSSPLRRLTRQLTQKQIQNSERSDQPKIQHSQESAGRFCNLRELTPWLVATLRVLNLFCVSVAFRAVVPE